MIKVFEELGDASRRRLLSELRAGPKSVSDLVVATFLKQANVSNHLARLRVKGIVTANKVGRQVYYSFANPQIEAVINSALANTEFSDCTPCLVEASKKFAKAATQGEEAVCREILDRALRHNLSLLDIYQDLLAPAMKFVGAWHAVEAIDTAEQQMAGAITERMMARVVQAVGTTRVLDRTALVGCAPDSFHVIGLRMVGDLLETSGWKVLFLGTNVPQACFLNSVEKNRPNLVLLSCVAEDGVPCGLNLIRALRASRSPDNNFVIGVGGRCVGEARDQFLQAGADFTCSDLRTFATDYLPNLERTGKAPRG